jgi:Zn-dependent peptidase ImmA (M78 family)
MAAKTIPITPAVLAWAVDESGRSLSDVAKAVKVDVPTVRAWLAGEQQPTRGEWTALASALKRPRSVFLLTEPPPPTVPPDLRTAVGRDTHDLRPEESLGVRRARRLQRFVSDLVSRETEELPRVEVPRVRRSDAPDAAGSVLRAWLDVSVPQQQRWSSASQALAGWRAAFEARGLVVVQLQLGKEGMRGFSLWDDLAPLVALNTAETNEARMFTLMHELAHLATRSEAACAAPLGAQPGGSATERWCDRVASAVLLPEAPLRAFVDGLMAGQRSPTDALGLARRTATAFKTSLRAAGLRLVGLQLATPDLYAEIERRYPNRDRDKQGGGAGGGRPAPRQRLAEVGHRTADIVLDAIDERRLTERDARSLLRLDGDELTELRTLLAS